QAAAYAGFGSLYEARRQPAPITDAACWSHARRNFFVLADTAKAPLALAARSRDRVYEALRDKKIIWPREIAKPAMAEKGIPETDKAIRKDIVSRFTNVMYDITRRGQLVKIGHGEGARWKL